MSWNTWMPFYYFRDCKLLEMKMRSCPVFSHIFITVKKKGQHWPGQEQLAIVPFLYSQIKKCFWSGDGNQTKLDQTNNRNTSKTSCKKRKKNEQAKRLFYMFYSLSAQQWKQHKNKKQTESHIFKILTYIYNYIYREKRDKEKIKKRRKEKKPTKK